MSEQFIVMTRVGNLTFPTAIKSYLKLRFKLPIEKLVHPHDFSIYLHISALRNLK